MATSHFPQSGVATIVKNIKDVLQSLYVYFFHSLKKTQKFVDLVDIMEIRGKQILKNIKTHWISILLPTKKVLFEYCVLVLKMHKDDGSNIQVAHNSKLLCDSGVMMGLSCIMPMLDRFNDLIKFSKSWSRFVYDFIVVVKLCQTYI